MFRNQKAKLSEKKQKSIVTVARIIDRVRIQVILELQWIFNSNWCTSSNVNLVTWIPIIIHHRHNFLPTNSCYTFQFFIHHHLSSHRLCLPQTFTYALSECISVSFYLCVMCVVVPCVYSLSIHYICSTNMLCKCVMITCARRAPHIDTRSSHARSSRTRLIILIAYSAIQKQKILFMNEIIFFFFSCHCYFVNKFSEWERMRVNECVRARRKSN